MIGIPGVGPKIASSILAYFVVDENLRMIRRMRDAGVSFGGHSERYDDKASPFGGILFCITGSLTSMTRVDAETRIQELGGRSTSNVTHRTTYLLVGDKPGSKIDDARRLDVRIIYEEQFLQMLSDSERLIL